MASSGRLTGAHGVAGALVPGDGRVRFCLALPDRLRAGDWVCIDGPLGQEPGRILFEAQRVVFPQSIPTPYSIERHLTDAEIANVEPLVERAQSLVAMAKQAILASSPDVEMASLRFTLDGATALCQCFGEADEPPAALAGSLRAVLGSDVRIEWSSLPARAFGGLGRFGAGAGDERSDVRGRLQIDNVASARFPHGWPRLGTRVTTSGVDGRLVAVSIRHQMAIIRLSSGERIEVPLKELTTRGV